MSNIVYIEFQKSKSQRYKRAVSLCKVLPKYQCRNDTNVCLIDNIKDYLYYRESINSLIEIVYKWKNSKVLLLGSKYTTFYDYDVFIKKLCKIAGKYSVMLRDNRSEVAMNDITLEDLPLPYVFYPPYYGAFFAFSTDIDKPVYLCECERKAIENALFFLSKRPKDSAYDEKRFLETAFPQSVAYLCSNDKDLTINSFQFKEGICFRCNKKIPHLTYCHSMYGGKFMQHYGWYVKQEYYRLGIDKDQLLREINAPQSAKFSHLNLSEYVNESECSSEIYDILNRIKMLFEIEGKHKQLFNSQIEALLREYNNAVENSVREQLGYKKIGDAWISETMLYQIVQSIYPEVEIIRHYRPDWLEGLELDIYIPSLSLALEYQGVQHFKAVKHWGGEEQLKRQQEHDQRKARLCCEMNIQLICINYDENLSAEYIKSRIDSAKPKQDK